MTLCVKNCSGSDPIHGSFNLTFRQPMALNPTPGYIWKNSYGEEISSVKCDFFDFGGTFEAIKLNYTWECDDGYYKIDNSCKGKYSTLHNCPVYTLI